MKKIAIALSACLAFGGCAGTIDTLSSPKTTVAAQNLGQFVKAFACGLSSAAASAQGVEAQNFNGKPIVDDQGKQITAIVYAGSVAACQLIGGFVTSATPVAVPATAVTVAAK